MPVTQATPPAYKARVLVVDDDDVTLEFVRTCLESGLEGVHVTLFNSQLQGRPGPDFNWGAYDLLLLDYNLGRGDTGVDWLAHFGGIEGFPRTLLLTAEDSARVIGTAVRRGADGYLNKAKLDPDDLVETLRGMLPAPATDEDLAGSGHAAVTPTPARPAETPPVAKGPTYRGRSSLDTGPGGASYRFIRLIGRGGMSRVYLAERTEDGTTAVLKILDADVAKDPENVKRFAREGELIARVNSPYVVHIFDHGFTNAYGYIAMEFFGRGDLAQRMEQGVTPQDAVLYLHNIACGLDAIHSLGIVHRDLKPGNVMFRGDGSMALADFGLAKRSEHDMTLTETGVILGTPYCMSPEQTHGRKADHRSDLYGAGVIFYEMLTGNRPFRAPKLPALLLAIQNEPAPPLPAELARYQAVMDRLLAKDPDARFQSAAALIRALGALV